MVCKEPGLCDEKVASGYNEGHYTIHVKEMCILTYSAVINLFDHVVKVT